MAEVDIQKLQQMLEALTKRVEGLDKESVPNLERRVRRLEDDVKDLKRTVASGR